MIVHSEWKGNGFHEGVSASGHAILFDADPAHSQGPSPMETILVALCTCTGMDVVSLLEKKRERLAGLLVTAAATQSESLPKVFTRIKLTFEVSGNVSHKAVEDSVELSRSAYSPAWKMLEKAAEIEYEIVYSDVEQES